MYRKINNLPNRPHLENCYSKDIRIVNTHFNQITENGLLFGTEKKILVETYQQGIQVFIERTPKKNEPCFLVCIESFELPIAVFIGRYEGNKYPTWDGK